MEYKGNVNTPAGTVYARGCTALREWKADAAKTVDARGCTALTELKADAAKTVDASGCTALTELKADAAEYVDASAGTALSELKADARKQVNASGCTALTELKAAPDAIIYTGPIQWYWHIHHEVLFELEREPIAERIAYIERSKPEREVATRLRLLKPIVDQASFLVLYGANDMAGIESLHKKECPDCPWNGRTIFP